ncbi:MAG TPA: class I SAM-dependent methyltransferase [Bryobacteraceae bacterium]|nr:class I SAM-dependent methyltransferase [Bryobacteraceae bacterium]HPT26887.1 class I SAM-dependent methyltransferase [Bryobacteraceae bacterium]
MSEATAARTMGTPSPELVFHTITAFQQSAALRAGIDLDLFSAVGGGCRTVAEIAARCSASERGIRSLCDYLTVIGFLSKQDGRYENTPASAAFLDRQSPACIGSVARFLHDPRMMSPWQHLTEIVRSGTTSLPGQGTVDPDNPVWVEFAHGMAPMMAPIASPLGRIVLADGAGPMRVLDIAAGHGLFGIEVARQNPEAHVVALDWRAVLEVARGNAEKAGVASRWGCLPGDAFKTDFGGPYDVILLTNFLHHFDPPTCVRLLRKVCAALAPGGRAATLEFIPNEDRVSPPMPAAFSLTMLATTRSGDAYTYSEIDAMHREAGFSQTQLHDMPPSPHRIVTAFAG